jgi:hypothetical protein
MQEVKKEERKDSNRFPLAVILFLVVVLAAIFLFYPRPLEKKMVDVYFLVGDVYGFNLDNRALIFGMVSPGGGAMRAIRIDNTDDFPVEIKFFASPNIAKYLGAPPSVLIGPKSYASVNISLSVPRDMPHGNYTGKLVLESWKR